MRLLALMLIVSALGAAEMRQLGANEDLPYCRVILIDNDNGRQVTSQHDGWYNAQTRMLYPLKAELFSPSPLPADSISKVIPAGANPGRMPPEWRAHLNAYIAKNHPQVPTNDPMAAAASPAPGASKP